MPKLAPNRRRSILLSEGGSPNGREVKYSLQAQPLPLADLCTRAPGACGFHGLPHCPPSFTQTGQTFLVARDLASSAPLVARCECCHLSSSDDDEHNTSNLLLLPCAHVSHVQTEFAELDELSVALSCRFALDIWTIMQHDCPSADQESSTCSGSLTRQASRRQAPARVDVLERLRAQFLQFRFTVASKVSIS